MSKFLKTLAVISALIIFCAGFTSCKNNDDDDKSTPTTTNTGFEGKYFSVYLINKLKTDADSENTIPYAQSSVEEVIFNSDGTGTYKAALMEYDGEEGQKDSLYLDESIYYTKSGSSLKFKLQNDEVEFTILPENKLYCSGKIYHKYDIEEIYAYVNMTDMSTDNTSSKTVKSKAIILGKDDSAFMKNIKSTFYSFAKEASFENDEVPGTYTKSETDFTFTGKKVNVSISGTLSESSDRTYLTIDGEQYRKL